MNEMLQNGDELVSRHHEKSPEIDKRVQGLKKKWKELWAVSDDRGKGLEEAKDILKFHEECDKVESWIRDKVLSNHLWNFACTNFWFKSHS